MRFVLVLHTHSTLAPLASRTRLEHVILERPKRIAYPNPGGTPPVRSQVSSRKPFGAHRT